VSATFGKSRLRVLHVKRGRHSVRITVATTGLKSGKLRARVHLKHSRKVLRVTRSYRACR
jgi:hypothetical protein